MSGERDEPPFPGAVYVEALGGWTSPEGAAKWRRRRRKRKPAPQLAETRRREEAMLSDDDRTKGPPDPLSARGRELARRRAEVEEVERRQQVESDELRGSDFLAAKRELRHDLLYGRVSKASADRQLAALEAKYPKAADPS